MRISVKPTASMIGDDNMAFDWESLGRLMRKRTLEAVAMHFAAMAAKTDRVPSKPVDRRERFAE
jgi:hypothetical protein